MTRKLAVIGLWLTGCAPATTLAPPLENGNLIEFRFVETTATDGIETMLDGDPILISSAAVIADSDIRELDADLSATGLMVAFWLTDEAAVRLGSVTRQAIGERIAILVDSRVRAAPVLRSSIGGSADAPIHINLPMTPAEAESLVGQMRQRWPG